MDPKPPAKPAKSALERIRTSLPVDPIKADRKFREYSEDPNDPLFLCFAGVLNQAALLGKVQQEAILKALAEGFGKLRDEVKPGERQRHGARDIILGSALALIACLLVWILVLLHGAAKPASPAELTLSVPKSWLTTTERGDKTIIVIKNPDPAGKETAETGP